MLLACVSHNDSCCTISYVQNITSIFVMHVETISGFLPPLQVLGHASGPDMWALYYGARMNYERAARCAAYPCTFGVYPPLYNGEKTFADASEKAAALPALKAAADLEHALEAQLLAAKRHPAMRDIVLDHFARWHDQLGGGALVVSLPTQLRSCDASAGPLKSCMLTSCFARHLPRYLVVTHAC